MTYVKHDLDIYCITVHKRKTTAFDGQQEKK